METPPAKGGFSRHHSVWVLHSNSPVVAPPERKQASFHPPRPRLVLPLPLPLPEGRGEKREGTPGAKAGKRKSLLFQRAKPGILRPSSLSPCRGNPPSHRSGWRRKPKLPEPPPSVERRFRHSRSPVDSHPKAKGRLTPAQQLLAGNPSPHSGFPAASTLRSFSLE